MLLKIKKEIKYIVIGSKIKFYRLDGSIRPLEVKSGMLMRDSHRSMQVFVKLLK